MESWELDFEKCKNAKLFIFCILFEKGSKNYLMQVSTESELYIPSED